MPMRDLVDRLADATVVPGFSRIGPLVRRRGWDPLPRLDGRTAVITGATSGIGAAAAAALAGLGATVVIVGRNPEKAERVRREIAAAAGDGRVSVELADLSLMRDVRELAERLTESLPEIHILVNNAGVLLPERSETAEGIETTLATNLLGHFLLTNLLLERLRASAPSRIINVSSGGMLTARIRPDDLQSGGDYDGRSAYARTKRGQVILTEVWAEQLRGTGVVVHSMHPGWVATPGVDAGIPLFGKVMGPLLRSPAEGADTIVWLAAAAEAAETSGLFWHDRRPRSTHRTARTRETAEDRAGLWEGLAELAGWSPV